MLKTPEPMRVSTGRVELRYVGNGQHSVFSFTVG
jgi:hypothetical protein